MKKFVITWAVVKFMQVACPTGTPKTTVACFQQRQVTQTKTFTQTKGKERAIRDSAQAFFRKLYADSQAPAKLPRSIDSPTIIPEDRVVNMKFKISKVTK